MLIYLFWDLITHFTCLFFFLSTFNLCFPPHYHHCHSFANLQFICHTSFPFHLLLCLFFSSPQHVLCGRGLHLQHYPHVPKYFFFIFTLADLFLFNAFKYSNPLHTQLLFIFFFHHNNMGTKYHRSLDN